VEAAVARGLLRDEADLALFLAGRLRGTGPVVAAVAAAGCLLAADPTVEWARWDGAVNARIPSAALREASRSQGAALLRTARRVWPSAALDGLWATGRRSHHPLVLGAVVTAAGDGPGVAALLALHHLLGGACSAAVRLLGLDPITVSAVQARMSQSVELAVLAATQIAGEAVTRQDTRLLPSTSTPLPEVLAELHARTEVTLFAS
jgi:urease accessory protein